MNKDFEKFGSEVYTPTLSFNGGRQFYNQNISLVLQEKYTYRVRNGFFVFRSLKWETPYFIEIFQIKLDNFFN